MAGRFMKKTGTMMAGWRRLPFGDGVSGGAVGVGDVLRVHGMVAGDGGRAGAGRRRDRGRRRRLWPVFGFH